jgi:NADH-quinone oxidoreductase subunit N
VIGAYYYIRVIKVMYFDDPAPAFDRRPPGLSFVLGAGAVFTTFFVLVVAPVAGAAQAAAAALFG